MTISHTPNGNQPIRALRKWLALRNTPVDTRGQSRRALACVEARSTHKCGFTLVELLVVIAIVAIVAALLVAAVSRSKGQGQRAACLNNLREINFGVHMYADDYHGLLFFAARGTNSYFPREWTSYVPRVRSYIGLRGPPSPSDKVLACPSDDFCFDFPNNGRPVLVRQSIHLLSNWNYTSYCFNAGNSVFRARMAAPGVLGFKLNSIRQPGKTLLVAEYPARDPFSWHRGNKKDFVNDSPNHAAFADGHASYVKFYFGPENPELTPEPAYLFDPPPGYDYMWSGN